MIIRRAKNVVEGLPSVRQTTGLILSSSSDRYSVTVEVQDENAVYMLTFTWDEVGKHMAKRFRDEHLDYSILDVDW